MKVMTVKIVQETNRVVYQTVMELPHEEGKMIAGFAKDVESAKKSVLDYAKGDVDFVLA